MFINKKTILKSSFFLFKSGNRQVRMEETTHNPGINLAQISAQGIKKQGNKYFSIKH